jgi:hypothetical protein
MLEMSQQQMQQLDTLRSSAHFRTRKEPVVAQEGERANSQGYKVDKDEIPVYQDVETCRLSDNITGNFWAEGRGETEAEALDAALANAGARPGDVPMSPAEMRQQIHQLQNRLSQYEGDPTGSQIETGNAASANESQEQQEQDGQFDEMSTSELAQAIQACGGNVPGGDRRKTEWRQEAERELRRLKGQDQPE